MARHLKKMLLDIDDFISVLALIGIISITIVNVFCRFVIERPIMWAEEVTLGLFVWLVFIGISSAMKRDGHIGIDYFVRKMPEPLALIAKAIRSIIIFIVLIIVFIYLGSQLSLQAAAKVTPVLGISYSLIDLAVPLGGALALIHFSILVIRSIKSGEKKGGANL